MARQPIKKSVRFEVFKRDSFTCQYCGQMAPDVVLEIDHINPVSKGGRNDLLNLLTSCFDCNRGKSNKNIGDNSEIKKQQDQLSLLNEKRNQLKLLTQWRDELKDILETEFEYFNIYYKDLTNYTINQNGKPRVINAIKKYGLNEVISSTESAIEYYFNKLDIEEVFNKIFKILSYRHTDIKNIAPPKLFYIRGILKNRLDWCNNQHALLLLKKAYANGVSLDDLQLMALEVNKWDDFIEYMDNII